MPRECTSWRFPVLLTLIALLLAVTSCSTPDPRKSAADEARLFLQDQVDKEYLFQLEMSVSAWMDDPLALELLKSGLESTSTNVRNAAIDALERRGDTEAKDLLHTALDEGRGAVKLRVARALARLGDPAGRSVLVDEYLARGGGEDNPESAARVITALARLDPEGARPFLEEYMTKGAAHRANLYSVLAEVGEPWARSLILSHLKRDTATTRDAGILALGRFGSTDDAGKLLEYSNRTQTAQAAFQALGHIPGQAVVARLERGLKSRNVVEKLHCAASLWRLGEREKARTLIDEIDASTDELDRGFKNELALTLSDIEDEETMNLVVSLVRQVDDADKAYRLSELRERQDPAIQDLMREALDQHARGGTQISRSYMATYAIEALVQHTPTQELFDTLVGLLRATEGVDAYVRVVAAAGVITLEKSLTPSAGA